MRRLSEDTLDRLYSKILTHIRTAEPFSSKIAICAFSLLLSLREPLSPESFLIAVAHMEGKTQGTLQISALLRICFNMITLDPKMNILRLAHASVQEFLEAQPEFVSSKTNGLVATSCLNFYICGCPAKLGPGLDPTEQFYYYSIWYWAEHYRAAVVIDKDDGLFRLVTDFMFDDGEISLSFIGWLEDSQEYSKVLPRHHLLKREFSSLTSQDHTPIFTACVFGMANLLDHITQDPDFGWNRKNSLGQTGLYLASSFGQLSIVCTFLDHGADVNVSGGRHGNPLQAACFEGYISIVQLLLDNGADPRLSGSYETAMQASMQGGQEEIALLLLQKNFEISDRDDYEKILQAASQAGQVKVVDLLQRIYGLSLGKSGSAKSNAIRAAISKGRIGVLERLARSAQDQIEELPADSIAIAAVGGHDKIIVLLLDIGLDIEHEGQFGTPLRAASLLGHEWTVQLLLDRGAKANTVCSLGNALEAAAMNCHLSIAMLLLHKGADANCRGGFMVLPCKLLRTGVIRK